VSITNTHLGPNGRNVTLGRLVLGGGALCLAAGLFLAMHVPTAWAQQCIPDVVNPSLYQRCYLLHAPGREVCRCSLALILPHVSKVGSVATA
jgi:hypothetical protein